jgi:hypothetical protein
MIKIKEMIKINDRFEIFRDNYCWHLVERKDGKDKNGNPKKRKYTTYFPHLEAVCSVLVDRMAGEACKDILTVIYTVKRAQYEINKAIRFAGYDR